MKDVAAKNNKITNSLSDFILAKFISADYFLAGTPHSNLHGIKIVLKGKPDTNTDIDKARGLLPFTITDDRS